VPATSAEPPLRITAKTDLTAGNDLLLVKLGQTKLPHGPQVRQLTLNEDYDDYGRLIQRLGTNSRIYHGTFGRNFMDPTTEYVNRVANLTADTHPMHFHLVNVQIISRQPFDADSYNGTPAYTAPARPPDANECGWKDTVRMNPREVTTVIIKFDLPSVPFSPVLGKGLNEYVWHCHILEHEEHEHDATVNRLVTRFICAEKSIATDRAAILQAQFSEGLDLHEAGQA
jgi:spore coat protein A